MDEHPVEIITEAGVLLCLDSARRAATLAVDAVELKALHAPAWKTGRVDG